MAAGDFALTELDWYLDNNIAVPLELIQRLTRAGYSVLTAISKKRFPHPVKREQHKSR